MTDYDALEKRITFCRDCGASWYDDGNNGVACPYCQITALRAERDALRSYIQELLADCEKWMETLSAKRLHALSKTDYEACLATIAKMRAFAAQERKL